MRRKLFDRWSRGQLSVVGVFVVAAVVAIVVPALVSGQTTPEATPEDSAIAASTADTPDAARARVLAQDAISSASVAPGQTDPANTCLIVKNRELGSTATLCLSPAGLAKFGGLIVGQPYRDRHQIVGYVGSGYETASLGATSVKVTDGLFTTVVPTGEKSYDVLLTGPAGERTIQG